MSGVRSWLLGLFQGSATSNEDLQTSVAATGEENIFAREILGRRPLTRWSSRSGRVVLIGDAAHAMHPSPGQGANMAFEDVAVLSSELLAVPSLRNSTAVRAAVSRYEAQRVPRANAVQAWAGNSGKIQASRKLRGANRGMDLSSNEVRKSFSDWVQTFPPALEGNGDAGYAPPAPSGLPGP